MWSSQEGSLLLWAFLLSIVSSVSLYFTRDQTARPGAVGDRHHARCRGLLHLADAVRRRGQPVRHAGRRTARRNRAEPAAAAPVDDHPPADALRRLRLADRAVRLRNRGADHPPGRRLLDQVDPRLRPDRLDLPLDRHHPRRPLVLHRTRLGWLLGLGSGRERFAHAVADRHRLHPLDHGPGEARHAQGLERQPDRRHLHARPARHLPRALRACCSRSTPSATRPSARTSSD